MNKTLKAIALSLLLGICFVPSTSFAQQFFSQSEKDVENTNDSKEEANNGPIGSGLAILVAAGAGYAVLKNRNK